MQTPPGWYRDPTDPTVERWWDGTTWTASSRHVPAAAPGAPRRRASTVRDTVAVASVLVVTVVLIGLVLVRHDDGLPAEAFDVDPSGAVAGSGTRPAGDEREPLPDDGVDFIEATGAYALRISETWDEVDLARGIGWYTGSGSRRFRDNVAVIIEDLPATVPLVDYVRRSVATIERSGMAYAEATRRDVVLSDGNAATVIDYRSEQGGYALGHRVVIALRGRVAVSVTFTSEADRFDDAVADVSPYLTSVQVR